MAVQPEALTSGLNRTNYRTWLSRENRDLLFSLHLPIPCEEPGVSLVPPQFQLTRHSQVDPHRSARSERPSERYHHNLHDVCESLDLSVGGARRNAGEALAEPVPEKFWRVND